MKIPPLFLSILDNSLESCCGGVKYGASCRSDLFKRCARCIINYQKFKWARHDAQSGSWLISVVLVTAAANTQRLIDITSHATRMRFVCTRLSRANSIVGWTALIERDKRVRAARSKRVPPSKKKIRSAYASFDYTSCSDACERLSKQRTNWRLLGRTRCWKRRRLLVIYTRQPWQGNFCYDLITIRRRTLKSPAQLPCHPCRSWCSLGAADAFWDWLLNAGSVWAEELCFLWRALWDELWASIWESFTQIAPLINLWDRNSLFCNKISRLIR